MTPNADPHPSASQGPTGVSWLSPPALRLHAVMILGVTGSAAAAWFEWSRALSGHALAWAYSFEWPLFALMGIYLWWRLLHQETEGAAVPERSRRRVRRRETDSEVAPDDPQLVAWDAYLTRLHSLDPPGGPPPREPA